MASLPYISHYDIVRDGQPVVENDRKRSCLTAGRAVISLHHKCGLRLTN